LEITKIYSKKITLELEEIQAVLEEVAELSRLGRLGYHIYWIFKGVEKARHL
jgi:hypothetical protein